MSAAKDLRGMPSITITGRAAKVMREQLQRRGTPQAKIRFGIRGGGCTGYSYLFEFEDSPRANDHVFVKDGVRVVVDPKSMIFLQGSQLHFVTGLMESGFKFINPNAGKGCGCGESFSPA